MYRLRGMGYLSIGDINYAVEDLNRATALGDRSFEVYHNRALALEKMGRYQEAISDLTRVLEIDPGHLSSLSNRGAMYFCVGEINKGIGDFSRVLEKHPHDLSARIQRGWGYLERGSLSNALEDLLYALDNGSQSPWLFLNLAALYFQTGDLDKAYETNKKAPTSPDSLALADIYFQRGLILIAMRRQEQAIQMYEQAISIALEALDLEAIENAQMDIVQDIKAGNIDENIAKDVIETLRETLKQNKTHSSKSACKKSII